MNEQKEYTPGTVNISTTEYRDLITELAEQKSEASSYRSKYWEREKERDALKEEVELLRDKHARLLDFIASSEEIGLKYKHYIIEKEAEKERSDY